MISTVVSDSPNKLFVAGLPNYLNDEQVKVTSRQAPRTLCPHCSFLGTADKFWTVEGIQSGERHHYWLV